MTSILDKINEDVMSVAHYMISMTPEIRLQIGDELYVLKVQRIEKDKE